MHAPALAIAWEFRQRHRWGLIGLAVYLLLLAAIKLLVVVRGQVVNLDSPESFAFVVVVPMTATVIYLLAVFSFGLGGDLAGRPSMYPARMFTLPVTTAALAGWPMLYGSAAMALLWFATRLLALWPAGVHVPVIWPAILGATFLAWTQVFTWLPYGLPGLRGIVAVLWLSVVDTVALLAIHFHAPESLMVAILAPQVPLAYWAASGAVARARRGEVPDWRGAWGRLGSGALPQPGRERFETPARAQAWFEWRHYGRSLPFLVGILLPFELVLLFVAGNAHILTLEILVAVMLTPPFVAGFVAATVRRANPQASDSYGVTPFLAIRPMTDADLIAAKLKVAFRSTLVAWLLVSIAIPVALGVTDHWPMVSEWARFARSTFGTTRAIVLLLLTVAGLIATTWRQLVQSLYIGLTGRGWLIKGSVFVVLAFLFLLGPGVQWLVDHPDVRGALWDALPWIVAALAGIKITAAAWIAVRLFERRLVSDRMLVTGAACWLAAVLVLYVVLVWLLAGPPIPRYVLLFLAILAVPLARLSAAPLALAWNRHR